ncbi:seven-hairpin glycosidase [Acaromyces ingoldii]|uniref:alpha-1,2-Mannosidase n=1 Tax=Acaromyces ingoldii TaxID=215250 RepID=A0A316YH52_9BASI|nr:seven-hairpin glycosidase [Acaromyces ingoldii]PWN88406.1 seven-hairpin glycosidase [Acaromyces ingoldii]
MKGYYHSSHDLDKLYADGNPHLGVIPASKLRLLQRDPLLSRPTAPMAAPEVPASLWVAHSGWSAAVNGSKTTYLDAYTPEAQPLEPEWRKAPFAGWQPPLEEMRRSASRRMPLPKVQHPFPAPDRYSGVEGNTARDKVLQERQRLVRNAFLHAWQGYKRLAWGHDELKPVTEVPHDNFNGWGATIVDALDTLLVMELPGEYDLARQHVRDIDFHLVGGERSAYGFSDGKIPVFETAIRYLGGFLSAYDLSGDVLMRDRAEELAQLIMPAFDTPTGVPVGRIKFDQPSYKSAAGGVILAEAASMLVEMTRLWQVTGNRTYFDRVQRTSDWLDRNMTGTPERLGTLLPTSIFPERGTMYGWYTWGGMADSAFEYLIKEHQLLDGHLEQYGRMFSEAMDSAHRWLLRHIGSVPNTPLLIMGQSNGRLFTPKLEHLTCFAGGSIGLSARLLSGRSHDLVHAERVTESCWWAYNATATGIGPEELTFYRDRDTDRFDSVVMPDGTSRRGNARGSPLIGVRSIRADYRNRPETIESVFYMWRITGDEKWQERGWQMFSSWVAHCMTDVGFSSIQSVLEVPAMQSDSMESFVFAETFKYYYLLFSPPDLISLDDYVFTTEAHPLLTPQKGRWARAGHGPKKLWDDAAPESSHTPPSASGLYAGGEGGPVGGLTNQQKHAILKRWYDKNENERKKQEAFAKAKANADKVIPPPILKNNASSSSSISTSSSRSTTSNDGDDISSSNNA